MNVVGKIVSVEKTAVMCSEILQFSLHKLFLSNNKSGNKALIIYFGYKSIRVTRNKIAR